MQLRVIKTLSELEKLETDWNNLLIKSASHVPFLRHEYLATWWKTLGGGEWEHGDLHVVTAYEDGVLIGAAPFFRTINLEGRAALMFLGSIEISDYLDLIAPVEVMPTFIEALLMHLDGPESPDWEVLDLYNLLEDSTTLPIIIEAAGKYGWDTHKELLQPAPSISLPNSWDDYLAGIKKKQRHEIRRKIRRAESHDPPISWYIVEDENKLDDEIEAFLQLMAFDPEKESFLTEVMQTQWRESVHTAFQAGWLQLAFLEFGGQKVAAYLNFDYANKIWVYNSGIDFKFRDLSPGWVLLAYLIQWAIDNGREVLDFMRGDEVYKYRFGGVNRYVYRLQVSK
jgi:CelD/BcsL family acetyltransferase involved in cellulose biosynthesis